MRLLILRERVFDLEFFAFEPRDAYIIGEWTSEFGLDFFFQLGVFALQCFQVCRNCHVSLLLCVDMPSLSRFTLTVLCDVKF